MRGSVGAAGFGEASGSARLRCECCRGRDHRIHSTAARSATETVAPDTGGMTSSSTSGPSVDANADTGATHEGEIEILPAINVGAPETVGILVSRFVRYPGCQQLIVWLPQSGYHGYGNLRVVRDDGAVIEAASLRSRLNGSVQILWDTLAWPAAGYRLEIDHEDGWRHVLPMRKQEPVPGVAALPAPALQERVAPPERQPSPSSARPGGWRRAPARYRNGLGEPLPDVDLILQEKLMTSLSLRFLRHLEYEGNFRGGNIIYVEGALRISFWHEMGGGGCKFYIDVPSAAHWEGRTGTPLARRDEILQFVADAVRREKASSWRYVIEETSIAYY
jgi:hypothetical protein